MRCFDSRSWKGANVGEFVLLRIVCMIFRSARHLSLYCMRRILQPPDMMLAVIGKFALEEYIAERFSIKSFTTRDELRNTHVFTPILHVNLTIINKLGNRKEGAKLASPHIFLLAQFPIVLVGSQVVGKCFQRWVVLVFLVGTCISYCKDDWKQFSVQSQELKLQRRVLSQLRSLLTQRYGTPL
jgi:hypothetical protein